MYSLMEKASIEMLRHSPRITHAQLAQDLSAQAQRKLDEALRWENCDSDSYGWCRGSVIAQLMVQAEDLEKRARFHAAIGDVELAG